jgi:hypothetical protein
MLPARLEVKKASSPFTATAELSGNILKNVTLSSDKWDLSKPLGMQELGMVLHAFGEQVLDKLVTTGKSWLDYFGSLILVAESYEAVLVRSSGKLLPWHHQISGKWWCHWHIKQLLGPDVVVLRCPACVAAGVSENRVECVGRVQQPRTVRGLQGEGFLSTYKYKCCNKGALRMQRVDHARTDETLR